MRSPAPSLRKGTLRGIRYLDDRIPNEAARGIGVERGRPEGIDGARLVREGDRRDAQVRANAQNLRCHDARNRVAPRRPPSTRR